MVQSCKKVGRCYKFGKEKYCDWRSQECPEQPYFKKQQILSKVHLSSEQQLYHAGQPSRCLQNCIDE